MNLSQSAGGAVPIGSTVYFAEGVPADVTINGARYLLSGTVETNTANFNTSIFTANLLQPTVGSLSSVFGTDNVAGLTYNGTVFVAVSNLGKVATSSDGVTWTLRSVPTQANFTTGVFAAFVNGLFFVGGSGNSTSRLYSSPDGITWTERTLAFGASNVAVTGIAYSGTRYVAVAALGYRSYSDNLTAWTAAGQAPSDARGVAFGSGTFVHTVASTAEVFTSTDGITWTSRTLPGICGDSIAFGAGRFVIVGAAGAMYQSTNGISWTAITSGTTSGLGRVVFGGGAFFVSSNASSFFSRSLDGITFESLTDLGATARSMAPVSSTDILVGFDSAVSRRVQVRNYAGARIAHGFGSTRQYVRIS